MLDKREDRRRKAGEEKETSGDGLESLALESFNNLRNHSVRDSWLRLLRVIECNLELCESRNDVVIGCALQQLREHWIDDRSQRRWSGVAGAPCLSANGFVSRFVSTFVSSLL